MSDKNKQILDQDENLMDHDYDGIKELDNPPPRWIMLMFYITIAWSILYGAYYFWLKEGDHQDVEYVKESNEHDQKYQIASLSSDELTALTDEESIAEGKQIYTEMACMACHGMNGEGNAIGPNLSDDYAIHGCDFESAFNTIKDGVPAKGMTAYKTQMSDDKIQKVASYILTLRETSPENAKEPQGEKCE